MAYPISFNPAKPCVMHIDLNSCFASVEQQANHFLRGKPVVVAAYAKDYGCILAPSVEAKLYGVKTGMSVKEGRSLCPFLVVREADPPKYRQVHKQIGELLSEYSVHIVSKSIDEYCLDFSRAPLGSNILSVVPEIKNRIKAEIGDWLQVSVGVSTNQILAKLASGLNKPDGFDTIDQTNYRQTYGRIVLQDFCGINRRNEARLNRVGIFTATQFAQANIQLLKQAFQSILGRYWYTRLRGYEVDDVEFVRRSYGQSYVLPAPMPIEQWRPILAKLVAKSARRLRASGYSASGVHLALRYGDGTSWHAGHNTSNLLYDDVSLLTSVLNLYLQRTDPCKKVKKIAFTCFGLAEDSGQLSCLTDSIKQKSLITSLDALNDKWGEYAVTYGSFLGSSDHVRDAIAFGK